MADSPEGRRAERVSTALGVAGTLTIVGALVWAASIVLTGNAAATAVAVSAAVSGVVFGLVLLGLSVGLELLAAIRDELRAPARRR